MSVDYLQCNLYSVYLQRFILARVWTPPPADLIISSRPVVFYHAGDVRLQLNYVSFSKNGFAFIFKFGICIVLLIRYICNRKLEIFKVVDCSSTSPYLDKQLFIDRISDAATGGGSAYALISEVRILPADSILLHIQGICF